jgi:type IX secretion system PorP/SprF family membrane protein
MKKIKITLGILALISISTVFGQQDPHYTQYMYNMNVINPAYAGSKDLTSIGLLGRSQWVGVDGAPRTGTFSIHSPVGNSLGIGLSAIRSEIGPVKEDNLFVDFSFTINTSNYGKLAFGLKAGANFLNVREFTTVDSDPLNVPINQISPNFGAGLFYYTDAFYLGFSVPNFLETRHLNDNSGIVSTASRNMHYFLTSGYVFDLSSDLKLKPSTLIKATAGAPVSIDLALNLFVNENVELGLAHSLDNSISGMFAFQVNNDLRIGYSYDHTTSSFGMFNSGSHEIMLLFDFNRGQTNRLRCF